MFREYLLPPPQYFDTEGAAFLCPTGPLSISQFLSHKN